MDVKETNVFEAIKSALADDSMRVHFDKRRTLMVSTDASPYGVGAVLLQKQDDGHKYIDSSVSQTRFSADRNYS